MSTLEAMEANLRVAVDLTVLLRNELRPVFGNSDIKTIKSEVCESEVCVKLNELKTAIIAELDKLESILHKDNCDLLKQTEVFGKIQTDELLCDDLLYHCEMYDRKKTKFNVIKLIHKDFIAFVAEHKLSDYPISYLEKRLNTIRFFCDYYFMYKSLGLEYFRSFIKYKMYAQALFLWETHLIHLMTSAKEAITEIHFAIIITGDFSTYTQLIYSIRELFPDLSVNLILRAGMDYFNTLNMLSEIIYSGEYERFQFLFEFPDFEPNFSQIIFNFIFDEIMFNYLGENILDKYNYDLESHYALERLPFNKLRCIKLITKLITVFTVSIEPNSRTHQKVLKFVGTTEKPEYFDLIDLLVYKGLCSLEDTSQVFKDTYISKRNVETFLCGLNRLVNASTVPYVDVEVFRGFLKV